MVAAVVVTLLVPSGTWRTPFVLLPAPPQLARINVASSNSISVEEPEAPRVRSGRLASEKNASKPKGEMKANRGVGNLVPLSECTGKFTAAVVEGVIRANCTVCTVSSPVRVTVAGESTHGERQQAAMAKKIHSRNGGRQRKTRHETTPDTFVRSGVEHARADPLGRQGAGSAERGGTVGILGEGRPFVPVPHRASRSRQRPSGAKALVPLR